MNNSQDDLFTTIAPEDLWRVYTDIAGIFRGGGNASGPRLVGPKGPRSSDFTIVYDLAEGLEVAIPDTRKGLSFSDSVERLQRIPIRGAVWRLPRGSTIPAGLIFHYQTRDHPLLNVSRRMPVVELTAKLLLLSKQLVPTAARIK